MTGVFPALERRPAMALAAVLVLALAVRLPGLSSTPLWLDEAYSHWFSSQDYGFLWRELSAFETHPPLYYTLLKAWRGVLGDSEAALRGPSALASLGVAGALFFAGRALAGPGREGVALGLVAASLAALWRSQIEFAQDARPYALLTFAAAVTLAGAVRLTRDPDGAALPLARMAPAAPGTLAAYLAVAVGMALSCWSHNLGAVAAACGGLALAAWWGLLRGRDRQIFVNLALTAGLAFALYAPNLPTLYEQLTAFSTGFWLTAPDLPGLARLTTQVYGQPSPIALGLGPYEALAAVAALIGLGVLGLLRAGGAGWRTADGRAAFATVAVVAVMAAGPWLLLVAVTYLIQPVLLPRVLMMASPAALLCLAGLPWLAWGRLRAPAAAALIAVAGAGAFTPVDATLRLEKRVYPAIVAAIAGSDAPDAPVYIISNSSGIALAYYADRGGVALDLQPLPAPYPARSPDYAYPAGGRGVPAVTDDAVARVAAFTGPTAWLLRRASTLYDPEDRVAGALGATRRAQAVIDAGVMTLTRFDAPAP